MKKITDFSGFKRYFFIFLSIIILNMLFDFYNQAASIGIIGGTDGPTAVFIAKRAG